MKDFAHQAQQLLGVKLTSNQLRQFELFERELVDWNTRFNLTAIQEPAQIHSKHFLDSLTCIPILIESGAERVIDVGSGAGFPGIPLKIAAPALRMTLVESVGKKAGFCQHVIQILGLENISVLTARAEELGQASDHRQQYDWAVARAVAVLPVLSEYLLPLVRVGGGVIAMKGENAPAEAHTAELAVHLLGGRLRRLAKIVLPGVTEERYLIIIDKVAATPTGYPRRAGLPAKRPITN